MNYNKLLLSQRVKSAAQNVKKVCVTDKQTTHSLCGSSAGLITHMNLLNQRLVQRQYNRSR